MACVSCQKNKAKKIELLNRKIRTIEEQLKDPTLPPAEFDRLQCELRAIRVQITRA